ncbi:hypothetical protein [Rufibacter ruber]|uniref:hypothetical protein n=1 Tax=Rufibacter ruber TaxID=1783499 RepID=UPI0008327648|nr:hypothetical protein [Rufibacter ruber]
MKLKDFTINSKQDVVDFFIYVMRDLKVNFHPDDTFHSTINADTKEDTFTPEEADHLDAIVNECWTYCQANNLDICNVANEVFRMIYYTRNPQNNVKH